MLTFESPFYEIEGVVVFRDHASLTTFHYLAGPPRLSRSPDGKPNLLLLKYRNALDAMGSASARAREQLGGAFLLFGVDCGVPQETKNAIASQLQSRVPPDTGPVNLVPVLYTKGKVSVVALDKQKPVAGAPEEEGGQQSKFVRGILGSSTPSLLQDQRAIFSISLTPDAATLIEEAYDAELSPIGVMYELDFAGLRPALAVRAKVDQHKVYEQFKLGLTLGIRSGGGQSDTTTTTTRAPAAATTTTAPATTTTASPTTTTASPTTTTAAPVGSATTTTAAAVAAVASTGTSRSTTPTTTTAAPAGDTKGTQIGVSADLSLVMEDLKETGAIEIEIIRQQEGQSVDQMEKNAMDLLKETLLNEFFRPAMTNAPSAASAAAAAGAASQMMATSADTNKGKAGKGTSVDIGFQLQYKRQEELKTATYDYNVVAPETRTHAPNGFFSALLSDTEKARHLREIDLNDRFFQVLDSDISTTADFEALDLQALVVDLQYGGSTDNPSVAGSAQFTPAKKDPAHFQAFFQQENYSYRYKLNYMFGQSENIAAQHHNYETPWQTTTSRALVAHPPDDIAMLHVFLDPGVVDWDVVSKIETRLIYEDPANQFNVERTFLVAQDSKRQEWIVRLTDPALTTYKVQNRWHLKDLSEIQGKATEEKVSHLFVGDPFDDRLQITVFPQVEASNVARISVELFYEDPSNNFEVRKQVDLEGPQFRRTNVTIPLMNSKRRDYTYTVSLIKPNGKAENHSPKETDQLSIVITEGGVYLDVDVVLIGDLAGLGIDALQLDLRSEPLEGELPKIESQLFLPGPEKRISKRLLLRADRPQVFEYRTKVLARGQEIENDWTQHQSKILLVQLQKLLNG